MRNERGEMPLMASAPKLFEQSLAASLCQRGKQACAALGA